MSALTTTWTRGAAVARWANPHLTWLLGVVLLSDAVWGWFGAVERLHSHPRAVVFLFGGLFFLAGREQVMARRQARTSQTDGGQQR